MNSISSLGSSASVASGLCSPLVGCCCGPCVAWDKQEKRYPKKAMRVRNRINTTYLSGGGSGGSSRKMQAVGMHSGCIRISFGVSAGGFGGSRAMFLTRSRKSRYLNRQIRSALLDPPPFDPSKLTIRHLPGSKERGNNSEKPPWPRKYTLTHNDITGSLQLSIGSSYNESQVSGWYTRILRDEVLAEWHFPNTEQNNRAHNGSSLENDSEQRTGTKMNDVHIGGKRAVLNVYCHVSGEELWPAPPALRSFIFQREMRLVLDTITYADRKLIAKHPSLASATIYVHLLSSTETLNRVIHWGYLGDKDSWRCLNQIKENDGWKTESDFIDTVVAYLWEPFRNMFLKRKDMESRDSAEDIATEPCEEMEFPQTTLQIDSKVVGGSSSISIDIIDQDVELDSSTSLESKLETLCSTGPTIKDGNSKLTQKIKAANELGGDPNILEEPLSGIARGVGIAKEISSSVSKARVTSINFGNNDLRCQRSLVQVKNERIR